MLSKHQEYKKRKGLCVTLYCRNQKAPKGNICYKCRSRKYRANNKMNASYQILKDNAKRRGKIFDLTLEEYKKFCDETGYLENKGKSKNSASIDRIDPRKGYTYDNIQVLNLSENSYKSDDIPF